MRPNLGTIGSLARGGVLALGGILALGSATFSTLPARADGESVKIGVLTDQSGPYAMVSGAPAVEAVRMAVEEFGGVVLGKPIEIVSADHKNDPELAANIALKWFGSDHVDMIADLIGSPVALAVQGIAKERGKIDIVTGAASASLTGLACSPTGFHWTYDTYALGRGAGAMVGQGDITWFFITTDAAFGPALQETASSFIAAAGGKVLGGVHHPVGRTDFSSDLLKAQASGAQVIGLSDAGADAVNLIRQAAEIGIGRGGQRIAGLLLTLSDVHQLGLELAQGMVLTTASYWDTDGDSRAWSKKFLARTGRMPNMVQAGDYSAVLHYLKAVQAAGSTDGAAVAQKMRELPVNDAFVKNGLVRADGLMQHDMLLAVVKSPADSKQPWDYLDILETLPGDHAFASLDKSDCPLVKN